MMDFLIMCIGNREGGDDGIGPYIADNFKNKKNKEFHVLDCGISPENYTSIVKKNKPKNLIIIDAVEMNLNPGDIRIVQKEKIGSMHISTHGIPIPILIEYLEKYVNKVLFIGIQPKKMSGEISKEIKNSGDRIINLIKSRSLEKIKKLN